jgi:hypothetical protein
MTNLIKFAVGTAIAGALAHQLTKHRPGEHAPPAPPQDMVEDPDDLGTSEDGDSRRDWMPQTP